MKRSKFNLTHMHSTTCDAGYLVPFFIQPTLPGDRFRIGLNSFIRCQPMVAPLMHEVHLYTQYWYVPYRLLWEEWEDFITGGENLDFSPSFPTIQLTAENSKAGSLADYFGFPNVNGLNVSAMPFRAMAEIWNSRYRDQDLQSEVSVSYSSGSDSITSTSLLSPSWKKDYFTTARPYTQRGSDISVPVYSNPNATPIIYKNSSTYSVRALTASDVFVGGYIDIWNISTVQLTALAVSLYTGTSFVVTNTITTSMGNGQNIISPGTYSDIHSNEFKSCICVTLGIGAWTKSTPSGSGFISSLNAFVKRTLDNRSSSYELNASFSGSINANISGPLAVKFICHLDSADIVGASSSNINDYGVINASSVQLPYYVRNNHSVIYVSVSSTGSLSVRDIRASSALQRYAERSLKFGNRYEEFIQREFGVSPRDSRIQRPEYLGGGSGILNISEVLQTAEATDSSVGTMRGHGIASISQRVINFFSVEHGLILGLLSIRPKAVYTQGVDREFLKRSRLDFYTPELANIGMQEVLQGELFATSTNAYDVFGYSERYNEYRYHKPLVTGEFRTLLNYWNMARNFGNAPALNDEFINMAYSTEVFKRPFAVQDGSTHSFLLMLKNVVRAYRPIPKFAKDILR